MSLIPRRQEGSPLKCPSCPAPGSYSADVINRSCCWEEDEGRKVVDGIFLFVPFLTSPGMSAPLFIFPVRLWLNVLHVIAVIHEEVRWRSVWVINKQTSWSDLPNNICEMWNVATRILWLKIVPKYSSRFGEIFAFHNSYNWKIFFCLNLSNFTKVTHVTKGMPYSPFLLLLVELVRGAAIGPRCCDGSVTIYYTDWVSVHL